MAFKDRLVAVIDEHGGRSQENLSMIADLARKIQPDFTVRYLSLLILGRASPRPKDYDALGAALGIPPYELIDITESVEQENLQRIYKLTYERWDRPDLTDPLIQHAGSSLRNQLLDERDLYFLSRGLLESLSDDEQELT